MNTALKINNKKYTYADYLKFPDDFKSEIIDGTVYNMTPAPLRRHQKISMKLSQKIANYLDNKSCEIYAAPFDVRLSENRSNDFEIKNVVQPDISVICDSSKLDEKGCIGAPDWIIEILSPATASKDMKEKFELYEKFGVREYWIIEPEDKIVMVFILQDGRYQRGGHFDAFDYLVPTIFADLKIDLAEIFDVERKKEEDQQSISMK